MGRGWPLPPVRSPARIRECESGNHHAKDRKRQVQNGGGVGHWPKVDIREGLLEEVALKPGWEEFMWKFNLATGTGKSVPAC